MRGQVVFDDPQGSITVLIAVAVRLYREGLVALLSEERRLRVSGIAGSVVDARQAARQLLPDVIIIDVSRADRLPLIRTLREDNSTCRILAFAVEDDLSSVLEYAEAGAQGFFTVNGSTTELVEAIFRTASGELVCSPKLAAQLLKQATTSSSFNHHDQELTPREAQVFNLLKQGRSNKEIASKLNIAHATVKNHVHHLLEKLHVSTRGQAIAVGSIHSDARLRKLTHFSI